jgi:hypothetical protein
MNWIWYEYEVDPSLNFVMVVWFVPSWGDMANANGQEMAVTYYGQMMYPYAYSQQ